MLAGRQLAEMLMRFNVTIASLIWSITSRALPGRRQRSGGAPDRLRLGLTGPGEPAPQPERMAGGFEDGTPVDDRRGSIHAKPHAFNDGGQVPRVNYPPADALEPGGL